MKIEWNGKRARVTYDDGKRYDGEYNLCTGCNGIGIEYEEDGNILHRGEWKDNFCIREMTEEEYNKARPNW